MSYTDSFEDRDSFGSLLEIVLTRNGEERRALLAGSDYDRVDLGKRGYTNHLMSAQIRPVFDGRFYRTLEKLLWDAPPESVLVIHPSENGNYEAELFGKKQPD